MAFFLVETGRQDTGEVSYSLMTFLYFFISFYICFKVLSRLIFYFPFILVIWRLEENTSNPESENVLNE